MATKPLHVQVYGCIYQPFHYEDAGGYIAFYSPSMAFFFKDFLSDLLQISIACASTTDFSLLLQNLMRRLIYMYNVLVHDAVKYMTTYTFSDCVGV